MKTLRGQSKSNIYTYICSKMDIQYQKTLKRQQVNNNRGSLCELFYSEYFTIDNLIGYLTNKRTESIIDFLANLLFTKRFNSQTFFFLPQICSLIHHKQINKSIEKYLIYKCINETMFTVCSTWMLNSYLSDSFNTSLKLKKLILLMESRHINGETKLKQKDMNEYNLEYYENKQKKLDYLNNSFTLYEKLKTICLKLKEITPDNCFKIYNEKIPSHQRSKSGCNINYKRINGGNNNLHNSPNSNVFTDNTPKTFKECRRNILIHYLSSINNKLHKLVHNELNKEQTPYNNVSQYIGYILPFDKFSNKTIVNFLTEYSFCFTTKERVPIKLTVECIDPKEKAKVYKQNGMSSSKVVNANTNHFSSPDNYLRNINDNVNKPTINENNYKKAMEIIEQVKYQNEHPHETIKDNDMILETQRNEGNGNNNNNDHVDFSNISNPFGDEWQLKEKQIKANSEFRDYQSLTIVSFIAKANDDLRQEQMTMQLIKKFDEVFKNANLPLKLRPYEIVITSSSSGLIEFLPDTLSIDAIKKYLLPYKMPFYTFFYENFKNNFHEAQKNFAESLAAYSIVSYLIAIKDRHNGNILLDRKGCIIHIDFGFILGISPGGNLNFENAPFKLTKDYIKIMGGLNSDIFIYYCSLIKRGILEARKHIEIFTNIIQTMGIGVPMPCFKNGSLSLNEILVQFKERFMLNCTQETAVERIDTLIEKAAFNWRTKQYDIFQKLTNDILP